MTREFYSVSCSGGKDSTALALWMREQELPHVRVFADTGWEAPETYAYLDYLREKIGPIETVRADRQMVQRVTEGGMWPARIKRWCTDELKCKPIKSWMEAFALPEGFTELVNVVGIRAEESAKRAGFPEREWSADMDCYVWRPLLKWTLAEVLEIHRRHGIKVNPLYQRGFERVGCFPCINASKQEIRLIAVQAPERIEEIARIEAATGNTMFTLETLKAERADPEVRECVPSPIDKVVAWAKTRRGGRVMTLFAEPSGCARWGLCETAPEEKEEEPPAA